MAGACGWGRQDVCHPPAPHLPRSRVRFLGLSLWQALPGPQFPPCSSPGDDIGLVRDSVNPQSSSAAPEGPNPGFTFRVVRGQWQHRWDGGSTSARARDNFSGPWCPRSCSTGGAASSAAPSAPFRSKVWLCKVHTKINPVLREPCTVPGARALPHSHTHAGWFNQLCSPMNLLTSGLPRGRGPCQ